ASARRRIGRLGGSPSKQRWRRPDAPAQPRRAGDPDQPGAPAGRASPAIRPGARPQGRRPAAGGEGPGGARQMAGVAAGEPDLLNKPDLRGILLLLSQALGKATFNRTQLASLVATNLLGQNATAIAATEAQYAEMWAQDVAAIAGYAARP